jgi:alpha-galactosidase
VVLDTEGLTIAPGERREPEELSVSTGPERLKLLGRLANRLCENRPPRRLVKPPTGCCSWYSFCARVTSTDVLANLDVIADKLPALKYVQVDDGYQRAMGDWLDAGTAFGRGVLWRIKE